MRALESNVQLSPTAVRHCRCTSHWLSSALLLLLQPLQGYWIIWTLALCAQNQHTLTHTQRSSATLGSYSVFALTHIEVSTDTTDTENILASQALTHSTALCRVGTYSHLDSLLRVIHMIQTYSHLLSLIQTPLHPATPLKYPLLAIIQD